MDTLAKKQIDLNPNQFIERTISDFVRTSPSNRLGPLFGDEPIFDQPLVGFADGDDPLFGVYQKVVHADHFLPGEILARYLTEVRHIHAPRLEHVRVISFVLPVNSKTRESNALEKEGPSLRWNHTRWKGQDFVTELSGHLVSTLESTGVWALAPDLPLFFKMIPAANDIVSNWSHRHAAYAAGLGTFSLNDGFITPRGMAMRCGSVIVNLRLDVSPRPYKNHLSNCLFYATGKCGACIDRCPGGAITQNGHDKMKCMQILFERQKPWLEGAHGPGYIGMYAGCGLCQTKVPCESRIPLPAAVNDGSKKVVIT